MRNVATPFPEGCLPPPHLLVVGTMTGEVSFRVTRHPAEQVNAFARHQAIARHIAIPSPAAERIARDLHEEFRGAAIDGQPLWYQIDWESVERALSEFDHFTGKRERLGDIGVGDSVQVEMHVLGGCKMRGRVDGIHGQRFLISLDCAIGDLKAVFAPRTLLKPILRPCPVSA